MPAPQWRFADFRLDTGRACLWQGARVLALTPKAFDVLQYLITHPDRVVTKDTLLDAVWPATAVSDVVVRMAIGEIRRALGDTAQAPRYIATVHRRGYRFLAPVVAQTEAAPAVPGVSSLATPDTSRRHGARDAAPACLPSAAERRHLTVLCCQLGDAMALAGRLDPEDYREVVHAYHQTCTEVMQLFEGDITQYGSDGVLVYFGYPTAHDDDAQRAVHAGLRLLDALAPRAPRLEGAPGDPVAVRLGVHTGLVVVGDVGAGTRPARLALGETPQIAAQLCHLAAPNTLVLSAATAQLIAGYFQCETVGTYPLSGVAQPLEVSRVLGVSGAQSRLEVAATRGLTPLVGRTQELGLLVACWRRVTEGMGQVVLLGGEAGIGKSRLVQVLKSHVASAGHAWLECQGSPYYQHTAFYPLTELVARRLLPVEPETTAAQQVRHLEALLARQGLSPAEIVPLLAPLLSLPLPAPYTPVQVSPAQQRQQTLHALLRLVLRLAAAQPLLLVVEDLHWADPSTLEWLSLLVDQGPTTRILLLCTSRPDFQPPWIGRSHCTQITLTRLPQRQATELTQQVVPGQALPAAVVAQIVAKTDGVPLFVEEVTKTVLESGLLQAHETYDTLTGTLPPLPIPATLHDALLARLDRLRDAKSLAQLGATLGREFSYALLQAVAPGDEETVQRQLHQLVAAELLYQQGLPPQATYVFKHALIQEAAYQSLLKSTRQQYHQHIAQVLAVQFPETAETQPELLAHHHTEAGSQEQAVRYWQQAGTRAVQRSAHPEAAQHLTRGLQLLARLPETRARAQQELDLHLTLGLALVATQGQAAPQVEQTYRRAQVLCAQMGDTPQRFPTLWGVQRWYRNRGALAMARGLGEQLVHLAQDAGDPMQRAEAHDACGATLFSLGDYAATRRHCAQAIALLDPSTPRALALRLGIAPGVRCLAVLANALWCLGFPEQAMQRRAEALTLAQDLAHPLSLASAQFWMAWLHYLRREAPVVEGLAETLLTLATAQGLPLYGGYGACWHGWARAMHGEGAAGLEQLQAGMGLVVAAGQELARPLCLLLRAEAIAQDSQVVEGLRLLTEARAVLAANGQGDLRAEVSRLHGALLLRQSVPDAVQAEACFHQALAVARRQQAKSLELRAAMSLARLWQQQGKRAEARELLAPVYGWFTEGFDTADLQEAKALLEALAG